MTAPPEFNHQVRVVAEALAQENVTYLQPEQLPKFTEILLARGYCEADVRGILGGNWLRVARQVWK